MLFGHHADPYLHIEILGHEFPGDGMTEHTLFIGVIVVGLVLMLYGAYAMCRDFLAWRRRTATQ